MASALDIEATEAGHNRPQPQLAVGVLGELALSVDNQPIDVRGGLRRRLILALLAAGDRPIGNGALALALWGEEAAMASAANSVQAHLSRLRRLLDPQGAHPNRWVVSRPEGYLLRPDQFDVSNLLTRVTSAESMVASDPARAFGILTGVLDDWVPPVAEDLPSWNAVCDHIGARILAAQDQWADLAVQLGSARHTDRIVALARAEPAREVRWCLAMRALSRHDRPVDALDLFREAVAVLRDEFGVDPGRELRLTHSAVLHRDPDVLPSSPSPLLVHPPPRPVTSFWGRQQEVAQLEGLTTTHRMVTVCGLGGVGKTRLVAHWVQRSGRTGSAHWVDLRAVAAGGVAARVAEQMGLSPGGLTPEHQLDTIVAATSSLPMLVVFDNADDVVTEVAAVVATLTERLPQLTVVTTSRHALGLPGERRLILDPLAVEVDSGPGPAVQLAAARLDPTASAKQAEHIARRTGGVPLLIELVAARPELEFTPGSADVLAHIVSQCLDEFPSDTAALFGGLVHLPLGAPPSLVASLARRVGVREGRAPATVRELVAAQLLTATPELGVGGLPALRYRVLQPVLDVTATADLSNAAQAAFDAVTAWVADRTRGETFTAPDRPGMAELLPETATVAGALDWAGEHDPEGMLSLAVRLNDFWSWSGRSAYGHARIEEGLAHTDPGPVAAAGALVGLSIGEGLARMASSANRLDTAIDLLTQAGVCHGPTWAGAHGVRAIAAGWQGDVPGFEEHLAVARAVTPPEARWFVLQWDQAQALSRVLYGQVDAGVHDLLGIADELVSLGDPDAATTAVHFAVSIAPFAPGLDLAPIFDVGDRVSLGAAAASRALLAGERARYAIRHGQADAIQTLLKAIRLTERSGNLRTAAFGRRELGLLSLRAGHLEAAEYELVLAATRLLPTQPAAAGLALGGLADLARRRGRGALQRRLARWAWGLIEVPGGPPVPAEEQKRLAAMIGHRPDGSPPVEMLSNVQEYLAAQSWATKDRETDHVP